MAVRGTNPISVTDWIRGDLDVATLVPWPFDDGPQSTERAKVSQSTAFGLHTLLRLTSPAGSGLARRVEGVIDTVSGFVPEVVASFVRRIPVDREDVTRPLWSALREREVGWRKQAKLATAQLGPVVGETLGGARERSAGSIGWPPPPRDGAGTTLVDFLATEAKAAPLEIIVTGHSKGGALAPALALWLVETRAQWDRTQRARIGCYTFAGPTPGNGAFGRRVGAKLDGPCRRVVNTNDLVTHAWDQDGIGSIPALYGGGLAWLAPVARAIQHHLQAHDYAPVGITPESFQGTLRRIGRTPDASPVQIVQQHLDAYLDWTGLQHDGITTLKLFLA